MNINHILIIFLSSLIILYILLVNFNKKINKELFSIKIKNNKRFNKNKKIAFIFLTVNDVNQYAVWEKFFKGYDEYYNIYIHPKFPKKVTSFFKKYIIRNLIPTKWGDVSLVQATNNLINEALKNKNNRKIILVSDSCIPIKHFSYIYNSVFSNNKSWFNYYLPNLKQGSKKHYYRIISLDASIRNYAFIHEQWFILDRKHAQLINDNTHLIKYFNFPKLPNYPKLIPDEMYYLTILNYVYPNIFKELQFPIQTRPEYLKHKFINHAIWYHPIKKTWKNYHPITFGKIEDFAIKRFKNSKALFARKFSESSNILKYWDYIIQ
jgi:hypothetical protein